MLQGEQSAKTTGAPDLWRLSAAEIVKGHADGSHTPSDVLEACLVRTGRCQPDLNMMVLVDADAARAAARESQQRWKEGRPLGPLDGVPISIKDNMNVAGLPTTWGSRMLRGFVAAEDELPVKRLRAAGAILFGKTNLPEFAMQGYTDNQVIGTTRNPWNRSLTPGGSSGGAAAAIAAGCGPLALATDGGGSIRRPASHCGVVGFKPSMGTVRRGLGLPEIFLDFEVAGPIGRSVGDVRALTQVLAGHDLGAPAFRSRRICFVPTFGDHPVDPAIATQVAEAAKTFEELGYTVEKAARFDLAEEINELWPSLSAIGLAWLFGKQAEWPRLGLPPGSGPDVGQCGPAAQKTLQEARTVGATKLFDVLVAIQTLERRLHDIFAEYDAILTPATAALPWPAADSHPPEIDGRKVGPRGHAIFTAFANAAGLPAIAMPSGWVGDLPTGFQLVGPRGADATVLALAQSYEEARGWRADFPAMGNQ